jgi:hypothetical protein
MQFNHAEGAGMLTDRRVAMILIESPSRCNMETWAAKRQPSPLAPKISITPQKGESHAELRDRATPRLVKGLW